MCGSAEWRQILSDHILPFALAGGALGDDVVEIGPGPGMTTDLLRVGIACLTAVELDAELAAALAGRLAGTNVEVVNADAPRCRFADGRFTGAVSLTMLHHVPTVQLEDRLFAEVARVVRPGGEFIASPTRSPTGSAPQDSPRSTSVPSRSAGSPTPIETKDDEP